MKNENEGFNYTAVGTDKDFRSKIKKGAILVFRLTTVQILEQFI